MTEKNASMPNSANADEVTPMKSGVSDAASMKSMAKEKEKRERKKPEKTLAKKNPPTKSGGLIISASRPNTTISGSKLTATSARPAMTAAASSGTAKDSRKTTCNTIDSLTKLILNMNRETKEFRSEMTNRLEKLETTGPPMQNFAMPDYAHSAPVSDSDDAGMVYQDDQDEMAFLVDEDQLDDDLYQDWPNPSGKLAGDAAAASNAGELPINEATGGSASVSIGFAQQFAVAGDVGKAIDQAVADSMVYMLAEKLDESKLADTIAKYPRPENVPGLKPPKVNALIWEKLTAKTKSVDVRMQRIQNSLLKGIGALVSAMTAPEPEQVDAIALLCTANYELSQARKLQIKPELNPAYAYLSKKPEGGDFLFGDDLLKSVKDITEERKTAAACTNKKMGQFVKQAYRKPRFHPYHDVRNKGANYQPRQYANQNFGRRAHTPFLGQRFPQPGKRPMPRFQGYPGKKQPPATVTRPSQ